MRNENDSQRKCNAIKITIFSAVFDGFWFSSVLTTNTSPLGEPQTESLFTWPLHRLFPIPCSELDVSTRVFLFIAVEFNFPFHSSWFARWKYRTWSSKTVLSLLPGGVKFSKSHFPEIWMGAVDVGLLQRLKGQPTMLQDCMRARQLEFSLHVTLVKIIWIFVEMFVFVIVICKIFHCYEHNLECMDVERSKSLFWQGNFLRHSREKYGGKYESRLIFIRSVRSNEI